MLALEKKGAVNSLVSRVAHEGRQWPTPLEWMPSFEWADKSITNKAVPIDPGVDSLPQDECLYWSLETANRDDADWLLLEFPRMHPGIVAEVELREGWK
jgi:hypothetical protein